MVAVDTIAALATAPGRGAVAVLRLSGPDAMGVLGRVAPALSGAPAPRRATLVTLRSPVGGGVIDRAIVISFPAPHSYTGEDVVEIQTHGGPLPSALVLEALQQAGARSARAGEFTQRAYLNGKMDLVQAEAVRDLVEASSEAFHRAAVHQMEGGLSRMIAGIREEVVGLGALLAHHIDFPDEDEPPTPINQILESSKRVGARLEALLATAPEGELLRDGALVVLAGRPNAGKSSLFNALLGMERAIVTPEAGTTRDALEASVTLKGFPFKLVDTAGIRTAAEGVEKLGIEVARRYLARAQVILLCVSSEWGFGDDEVSFLEDAPLAAPVIVLRTKADRVEAEPTPGLDLARALRHTRVGEAFPVSVRDGTGLAKLRNELPALAFGGILDADTAAGAFLTRRRHAAGVRVALSEVEAFGSALDGGVPAEMADTHLKAALSALEEILGVVSPDDILDRVFAEFCIGK